MKSIILCEGTTDLLLLQFLLEYKYGYKYKTSVVNPKSSKLKSKTLDKDKSSIEIRACDGIDNIPKELKSVIDKNIYAQQEEVYHTIMVLIDKDTAISDMQFLSKCNYCALKGWKSFKVEEWLEYEMMTTFNETIKLKVYFKSIPEVGVGAIENVMLDALSTDSDDKIIVNKCEKFIDHIKKKHASKKYIKNESAKYKAIFNTYFAIRIPNQKYNERAKILRAYDWVNNDILNQTFSFLDEL